MLNEYMSYEKDNIIRYVGQRELHFLIPRSYESYQMIKVDKDITTLGIFPIWFDEETEQKQFFLPGMITICPSEFIFKKIGGEEYVYGTFHKGDIFLKNKYVVKAEVIAFVLFSMYLEKGKIPDTIPYDKETFIFDIVSKITGSKVSNFNHTIFEIIYAHLARNVDNIQQPYRLTDMKKPPRRLKLSDAAHITTSLTAKLASGYLKDSISVALTNQNEDESQLEELLRQ